MYFNNYLVQGRLQRRMIAPTRLTAQSERVSCSVLEGQSLQDGLHQIMGSLEARRRGGWDSFPLTFNKRS